MATLYLTYNEHHSGGDIINPEDRWSDREPEYIDFYVDKLFLDIESVPGWLKETIDVPFDVERGDVVHLVIVRYSTGDTFGSSSGHWALMGASKDSTIVTALADRIRKDEYDGEEEGIVGYHYAPWRGYFESLDDVNIETMLVQ